MSIYAISDLHLSFNTDKPMDIFGWEGYENQIQQDWKEKVSDNDLVILSGDFSWEEKIENAYKDFEFIHNLPGKKILVKGNHDYWWTTLKKMREFIQKNNFDDIDFLSCNSYEFDSRIIVGTRGWTLCNMEDNDEKIKNREVQRLELSINDGLSKYGKDKEMIACLHYPPLTTKCESSIFTDILKKYDIKECIYGHLHGSAQNEAMVGVYDGIKYIMASCDYTNFKLIKIS